MVAATAHHTTAFGLHQDCTRVIVDPGTETLIGVFRHTPTIGTDGEIPPVVLHLLNALLAGSIEGWRWRLDQHRDGHPAGLCIPSAYLPHGIDHCVALSSGHRVKGRTLLAAKYGLPAGQGSMVETHKVHTTTNHHFNLCVIAHLLTHSLTQSLLAVF